jgi:hypothetical protein
MLVYVDKNGDKKMTRSTRGVMNARMVGRFAAGAGLLVMVAGGLGQTAASPGVTAAQTLTVGDKKYDTQKELARLSKRYGLSEEQKTKIQAILLEQQKRVHSLGEDESLSNAEWASAVRKVHLQAVAEVKLQMTDAQASRYARDEAKRAKSDGADDDMDGPPDGPPPGGPPPGGGPGGGPPEE